MMLPDQPAPRRDHLFPPDEIILQQRQAQVYAQVSVYFVQRHSEPPRGQLCSPSIHLTREGTRCW